MPSKGSRVLMVYTTQSGGTSRMVDAVERGLLREENVEVRKLHGTQAAIDDLLWCDALVIGTPENFGSMAGAVKDFFDRTFYPAQGKVDGLPYALVVKAGNDGTFAIAHVERIARGYPLTKIAEPILCVGELEASHLEACEELGHALSAGLALGIFGRSARR